MRRHGFLIDMDGVIYRGKQLMPGAEQFIARLLDENIPFVFLTNNSQRTRRDVATKLNRMGIDVTEEHIFTCAMATARFLAAQKPGGTAFVIGEGGLLQALAQERLLDRRSRSGLRRRRRRAHVQHGNRRGGRANDPPRQPS